MVSLRILPPLPQLALAAGLLCLWVCAAPFARAQDRLTLTDKSVQTGKVVKVDNGAVVFAVATGQLSFPLNLITRVEAAAPPTYATGMASYQRSDWDKALADLKPIADTYHGLPTEWAQAAVGALGNIFLEKNDIARAEAAFTDFRRYYPAGTGNSLQALQAQVAQARILLAKNDAAGARKYVDPLTAAALKTPAEVTRASGAAYGQAFYVLAKLQERENKYPEALENYLRVVTLFYQDEALAAKAQKSADELRAQHKDVTAP